MSNLLKLAEEFKEALYSDNFSLLDSAYISLKNALDKDSKLLDSLDCPEYFYYQDDLNYMSCCLSEVDSSAWNIVKQKNNITVETRGGGNEFYTRNTVLVNADLAHAIAVLSEIDLVPTW
jgi:hypothetical protein